MRSNQGLKEKYRVLLVEDSSADVRLTQEALKLSKYISGVDVINDGVEALKFIYAESTYKDRKIPDLILLDLNLPRKDGRQVLQDLKKDPVFRRIPVIVLTTSEQEVDVLGAYDVYANCYIRKPLNLDDFFEVVRKIEHFWFSLVKLPTRFGNWTST